MASKYQARVLIGTVTELETWKSLEGETRNRQIFPPARAETEVIWWGAFDLNNEI